MRIGGLVRQSLVDWPGNMVAVIFTKGCNYRCSYCHNPLLVLPEMINRTPDIPSDVVLEYLTHHNTWLDGVVVTGGEPTLQADLIPFLSVIREAGLKIKLDTNGSNPAVLQNLIDKRLVDFIAMDIKAALIRNKYEKITGVFDDIMLENVLSSISIIRESGVNHMFKTTFLPHFHSESELAEIREMLGDSEYNVQKFRAGINVKETTSPHHCYQL